MPIFCGALFQAFLTHLPRGYRGIYFLARVSSLISQEAKKAYRRSRKNSAKQKKHLSIYMFNINFRKKGRVLEENGRSKTGRV